MKARIAFPIVAALTASTPSIENALSVRQAVQEWRLGSLIATLGEPASEVEFDLVSSAFLTTKGIVVADGGAKQLRFFGNDLRQVSVAGRDGSGPGEFRRFTRVFRVAHDSFGVYDAALRRVTIVGGDGDIARTMSIGAVGGGRLGAPTVVGILSNGSLASFTAPPPNATNARSAGLVNLVASVHVHSPSGGIIRTLGQAPGGQLYLEVADGQVASWTPMCQRVVSAYVQDDRIFIGDGSTPAVVVFSSSDTASAIRWTAPDLRLSPRLVEQYRQRALDSAPTEARRRQLEMSFDRVPVPEKMPAYDGLLVDREGNVWVAEYLRPDAQTRRWRVFRPDGSEAAQIVVPMQLTITDVGRDRVIGVMRDASGLETVKVYALMQR
jgi:hypothetical protein